MSKITLAPNASGTGTLTIAAPNTNTDRTLTLPDEAGTVLTSASTVAASQITGALNATGSAPIYACRAWVNFNGTGTVAIRASGNVTSITDNGTGSYTVNFTTAMPDANYTVVGTANQVAGVNRTLVISGSLSTARTTTSALMIVVDTGTNAGIDSSEVCLAIFR